MDESLAEIESRKEQEHQRTMVMYFPPLRRMRIRRGGPPLPIPVGTMRRQWIQWPRIQSSWIHEVTPANANNAGRGMDAAEATRRRTP